MEPLKTPLRLKGPVLILVGGHMGSKIASNIEAFVADTTLERFLARVNDEMTLQTKLGRENLPTEAAGQVSQIAITGT